MMIDSIEMLEQSEKVYIYGAGIVADKAISYFQFLRVEFEIIGICISKDEGLSQFRGLPVTPLENLKCLRTWYYSMIR